MRANTLNGVQALPSSAFWGVQVRGARVTEEAAAASVLVVDDDPVKRMALKAALSPLGLPIVEADSGQNALRRVMQQTFAVILLDVRMPEMNGFETAALIRTQRESEMTPIIFITAYANEELGSAAKYVEGAVDFIFAPVPPDELRAKVSVFVNLYAQAERFAAQAREVQASADHLKLLTDAAPIGIFRTDAYERYLYTNPRWTEITGVSSEEAFGRDWDTIIGSSRPPGMPVDVTDLGDEEPPRVGRRYELWLPDSVSRIVLLTSEAIHEGGEEISGWVGTLDDVTVETRAAEERSRFQSLIQNSRDVIAVIDASGRCSYVSPGVFEVSGFLPEEVVGALGFDFIHPDDVKVIAGHLDDISSTPNAIKTVEVRTRTKSKGWIWIEIRATNRLDDPSVEGIVMNYHDITERRDAVQRIAQSEKLLAEGQALSHLGSFTWDMRTDDLTWSDEQYRLLGFAPGSVEASFETLLGCIHPEDRDAFSRSTQVSMETGASFELDFRVVEADESVRWIHGRGEVLLEDGVPIRLTGMSHDITDRKKAEEERLLLLGQQRELATRLRMLLDSTGEGIYGLDETGACTFMNKAGAALLGAESDLFIGQDMHQLTHHTRADGSVYPSEACPVYKVLATGLPVTGASEVIWRADGTSFPADYSAYPTGGDDGEKGVVVAFQNVTERERKAQETEKLESQLLQAQKMEAVGQLAGGVAHDFNNILSVILNYAQFASDGLDPDDTRLADIKEISKAGEKAAKLVHQLLAFSREEIVEERIVDLNAIVIDVYQILNSSLGEDIDLAFKPLEGLPPVKADPGRIEQVLLNLAVNARDAMPSGGTLHLSTGTESVEVGDRPPLEAGEYVWITVGDSGIGMDEATLKRAFEPFFTTKARGEGSGMGLSSAYGIIEQAGGYLFVDSEPGVGTTFSIYLPRSEAVVDLAIDEEVVEVVRGTETILLVEDEDAVRELVSRILKKQGYNVVPYASGLDALDYCRSNLEQIDLLLTDVVMPKISGKELSEQASSICEGLKTLFMSGYTDALIAQRGVPASGDNLITKPFKPEKLLVALRGLLDTKVAS